MRGQISAQDAGSHSLLRDHGNVEKGISGPVVAMGFGINDVAQPAAPFDLTS